MTFPIAYFKHCTIRPLTYDCVSMEKYTEITANVFQNLKKNHISNLSEFQMWDTRMSVK